MKTINVRVLVNDDVDPELFVQQLVTQTRGAGAPLGAVKLLDEGYGRDRNATVHTRANVEWSGLDLGHARQPLSR